MTEKRYYYNELKDGTYGVFKDKYHDDIDISFSQRFCIVENEEQVRRIVGQLNGLVDENEQLKKENEELKEDLKNKFIPFAETDGDYTTVNTEEFIKVLEENEQLKQEVSACYDTLTTIQELCYAVLNHEFKGVKSKVDYCHMLNDMDNKDLAFLKECFEAIQNGDLKEITQLTKECEQK